MHNAECTMHNGEEGLGGPGFVRAGIVGRDAQDQRPKQSSAIRPRRSAALPAGECGKGEGPALSGPSTCDFKRTMNGEMQ